jgi:hypothetical protein
MAVKLWPVDHELVNARLRVAGIACVDQLVRMTEMDLLRVLRNLSYLELVEAELAGLGLKLQRDTRPGWLRQLLRWSYPRVR